MRDAVAFLGAPDRPENKRLDAARAYTLIFHLVGRPCGGARRWPIERL